MKSEYDLQAEKFLNDTGTSFKAKYFDHNFYFADDKDTRDIYKITLRNSKGSYTFKFGQSIANCGQEPDAYDVLAGLTTYDVGSLEDFCSEFGYDVDSRKAEKIYKAVCKEYQNLCRLFTSEQLEKLAEIR
jgi:hypothetical protein